MYSNSSRRSRSDRTLPDQVGNGRNRYADTHSTRAMGRHARGRQGHARFGNGAFPNATAAVSGNVRASASGPMMIAVREIERQPWVVAQYGARGDLNHAQRHTREEPCARAPCIASSHESRRSTGTPTRGEAHGSASSFNVCLLLFTCPCRRPCDCQEEGTLLECFHVVRQALLQRE